MAFKRVIIRRVGPLSWLLGSMDKSKKVQQELDEFVTDLFQEDELGSVVRTHIRIEALLIRLLEALAPKPKHLAELPIDFHGRVTLALVLGLNARFGPPLKAIGTLRNEFAHKLGTRLNKSRVTNIYNALSPEDKNQVKASFERIKGEHESTRHIKKYVDLELLDQFRLISTTLWAALQAAVLNHEGDEQ